MIFIKTSPCKGLREVTKAEIIQTTIRLPESLYDRLRGEADRLGFSLKDTIVLALWQQTAERNSQ